MRYKRALIALLVAITGLTAAGCAGAEPTNSGSPQGSGRETAIFNRADVSFVQQMIPHHRQAVQMAELARQHAASPKVKKLAKQIESAQKGEIAMMRRWLGRWGMPSGTGMGGSGSMDQGDSGMKRGSGDMKHGGAMGDKMSKMMGGASMTRLQSTEGMKFDHAFLTAMIKHHRDAIEMARTEVSKGESGQAVALAKQIQRDQSAEINMMRNMLDM